MTGAAPDGIVWRKSSLSSANGECVEVATVDDRIFVRDSRDAHVLVFSRAEWAAFLEGVQRGEFDEERPSAPDPLAAASAPIYTDPRSTLLTLQERSLLRQTAYVSEITAEARQRDRLIGADSVPLTIYVSDDALAAEVVDAVSAWVTTRGEEIMYCGNPVLGSWWRAMASRITHRLNGQAVEAGLDLAGRAVGLYGLDTRQAEVNKGEAEAFEAVMRSLEKMDSAVIHHGTLLVVKHGGSVVRIELDQCMVEHLRRNPILTTQPGSILVALQALANPGVELTTTATETTRKLSTG